MDPDGFGIVTHDFPTFLFHGLNKYSPQFSTTKRKSSS